MKLKRSVLILTSALLLSACGTPPQGGSSQQSGQQDTSVDKSLSSQGGNQSSAASQGQGAAGSLFGEVKQFDKNVISEDAFKTFYRYAMEKAYAEASQTLTDAEFERSYQNAVSSIQQIPDIKKLYDAFLAENRLTNDEIKAIIDFAFVVSAKARTLQKPTWVTVVKAYKAEVLELLKKVDIEHLITTLDAIIKAGGSLSAIPFGGSGSAYYNTYSELLGRFESFADDDNFFKQHAKAYRDFGTLVNQKRNEANQKVTQTNMSSLDDIEVVGGALRFVRDTILRAEETIGVDSFVDAIDAITKFDGKSANIRSNLIAPINTLAKFFDKDVYSNADLDKLLDKFVVYYEESIDAAKEGAYGSTSITSFERQLTMIKEVRRVLTGKGIHAVVHFINRVGTDVTVEQINAYMQNQDIQGVVALYEQAMNEISAEDRAELKAIASYLGIDLDAALTRFKAATTPDAVELAAKECFTDPIMAYGQRMSQVLNGPNYGYVYYYGDSNFWNGVASGTSKADFLEETVHLYDGAADIQTRVEGDFNTVSPMSKFDVYLEQEHYVVCLPVYDADLEKLSFIRDGLGADWGDFESGTWNVSIEFYGEGVVGVQVEGEVPAEARRKPVTVNDINYRDRIQATVGDFVDLEDGIHYLEGQNGKRYYFYVTTTGENPFGYDKEGYPYYDKGDEGYGEEGDEGYGEEGDEGYTIGEEN